MKFEFDVPFEIGQQVWLLEKPSHYPNKHQVTCGFCEGRKEITGANGIHTDCPVCFGSGYTMETGHVDWIIANRTVDEEFNLFLAIFVVKHAEGKIDNPIVVRAQVTFDEYNGELYENGDEDFTFPLGDLFSSFAEAEAECDRRNILES